MKYYKELTAAIISEDFYLTDEIISKIKTEDDSIEYVTMILTFMENNPDIDYGMPGPIVHYVEKYCQDRYSDIVTIYGYRTM